MRSLNIVRLAAGCLVAAPLALHAESFNLRIGSGHPSAPTVYVNQLEKLFVPEVSKRVKERTQHAVSFTEAYGGSVAKVNETVTAVQSGLLDVGAMCFCFEPSRLFVQNFPYWVPFGPPSAVTALRATRKTYDQFPQLSAVFEERYQQKLLALSGLDNYHLGTTFEWEKLGDLKGRKIGAAGPNIPWLQGSGAVGVSTTLPEVYNGLKSGLYEGVIMFPSSYAGFKFYEPAPHYKLVGFGAMMVNGLTINLRTWNRLPKDVQAIIAEVAREYENQQAIALDKSNEAGLERLKAGGGKITRVSDEARRQWAEGIRDWPDKMAKDVDKAGLPGSQILKSYIANLNAEGWRPPVEYVIR
jgi:TRAP-type C4-dicarboxylate transport system substrate-binding protein